VPILALRREGKVLSLSTGAVPENSQNPLFIGENEERSPGLENPGERRCFLKSGGGNVTPARDALCYSKTCNNNDFNSLQHNHSFPTDLPLGSVLNPDFQGNTKHREFSLNSGDITAKQR
jgi:hypothetical protein